MRCEKQHPGIGSDYSKLTQSKLKCSFIMWLTKIWVPGSTLLSNFLVFSHILLTIAQRSQNYVSFPFIHSSPSNSAFSKGWGAHYHREIWFLEFSLKKYLTTFWNTPISCGLDTGLCPYFMKLLIPGNNKGFWIR